MNKQIVIFLRGSTSNQNTDAKISGCRAYAERSEYQIVSEYRDTIK